MLKCKDHPKYTGKQKPRRTIKNPDGCAGCWGVYFKDLIKLSENNKGRCALVYLVKKL